MAKEEIVYGKDVPYMTSLNEIPPNVILIFKPLAMPGSASAMQNPHGICHVEK